MTVRKLFTKKNVIILMIPFVGILIFVFVLVVLNPTAKMPHIPTLKLNGIRFSSSVSTPLPPVDTSQQVQPKVLFFDALNGRNRLLTNEYVHWNASSGCPYKSDKWDMTSGTLMIKDGAGYSGVPTLENESVCESSDKNNSAVFRLNTKDYSFANTSTTMDFKLVKHGGGGAPINSYDGVHIWTRYQSQYALYVATIDRWDGIVVIKKKVPVETAHCSDPTNGGCYYNISSEVQRIDLEKPNVWHHAEVIAKDKGSIPYISLFIDGKKVVEGSDDNIHGPTYRSGAVGVRGDNTEFYFKNFIVNAI